jgi:DNA-binding Xre family transcriptional regulator
MPISYRPLWVSLAERGLKKGYLRESLGFSSATVARMGKNEYVSLEAIDKICSALDVPVEKVISYEREGTTD